jgi:hypothetical protein
MCGGKFSPPKQKVSNRIDRHSDASLAVSILACSLLVRSSIKRRGRDEEEIRQEINQAVKKANR